MAYGGSRSTYERKSRGRAGPLGKPLWAGQGGWTTNGVYEEATICFYELLHSPMANLAGSCNSIRIVLR